MNPDTTSVIRDIFVMVAAGVFVALGAALFVLILKLYRPLREIFDNAVRASGNLRRITEDFAGVSGETADNIAQTSRNLVELTENAKNGTEEFSGAAHTIRQASDDVAAVTGTAARVAEIVGHIAPPGASAGAVVAGVGPLLRMVRGMLGENRRSGGGEDGQ